MPLEGDYEPSLVDWIREQVENYESSGGSLGGTLWDTGRPIVIVTMRGAKSGKIRKVPPMRVEYEGTYAAVASNGGTPDHPVWYFNLRADPRVDLQDGDRVHAMLAREVTGEEKDRWWARAVAAFPSYVGYRDKAGREIPVFVLEPVSGR